MVPAGTGLANGVRRPDQCAETSTRFESLPISRRRRHEAMGWTGCDCGQSDQYRQNFGSSGGGRLKRSKKSESAGTSEPKSEGGRFKSLFLRRKVASLTAAAL